MNDDIELQEESDSGGEFLEDEGAPASAVKRLKEELKICKKEKEEYLAGWQRSRADFINARKEEEDKRSEFARLKEEKVLRDLLEVADSFDASLAFKTEGVPEMYKQFFDVLRRYGVVAIETSVGKPFDPLYHEAIGQTETDILSEDETVKEELQKGYRINGRVLRPAKVKVAIYKTND